jgi:hypothetical protein
VVTPPLDLLCSYKRPADVTALEAWLEGVLPRCHALVASSEMLLYGGLIASR